MPSPRLQDVTGFRGEKIVELRLTDFADGDVPLFRPGFLGDKWPAIDFYVELNDIRGKRPFFLIQCKTTRSALTKRSKHLHIHSTRRDIERLLELPGPTYIVGVHEPTRRVFVKAVHQKTARKAITRIELKNELTRANLHALHREVTSYWHGVAHKPMTSAFK